MWDMFFRPSGAWGDFTRIPHPRLAPWATIFRPLRGLRSRVGMASLGGEMPAYRGWRRAQLCGLCSFRLHTMRGFAPGQPQ